MCYISSDALFVYFDLWHKTRPILRNFFFRKTLNTTWKNLQPNSSVLAVTEAEESKFLSTNYWSCWMLTLLSSWTMDLSSAIVHLSIIFRYDDVFSPLARYSKVRRSKRQLVSIQVKKWNRKYYITLKVDYRNFYKKPNFCNKGVNKMLKALCCLYGNKFYINFKFW